jgi:hypothetical protein
VDAGIVVVAAGNNARRERKRFMWQVHAPENEPSVITVGAANTLVLMVATMTR